MSGSWSRRNRSLISARREGWRGVPRLILTAPNSMPVVRYVAILYPFAPARENDAFKAILRVDLLPYLDLVSSSQSHAFNQIVSL